MAEIIRMPRMSATMEEGNIIGWLKEEGEEVESGETIAEVETDKATMELDCFFDGVLLHIAVKEGPVPIDGIIAVVGEAGEDWQKAIADANIGQSATCAEPAQEVPAQTVPAATSTNMASNASAATDTARIKASPLARTMAEDAGISLTNLIGSGDGGRIIKRDVEAAMGTQTVTAPAPTPAPVPVPEAPAPPQTTPKQPAVVPFSFNGTGDNFEDQPISQMRKVIARRLGESKFTAPHFYLTIDIDMDKAIQMRKRVNEVAPTKISFNDFVIKAAAAALRQHPAINASWLDDKIRYNKDFNIGVAVAVDEGLLVPVIRYADMKTLSQINTEVKLMAGKAKDRKLKPEEMQGNTFTISNLGMFGIEEFTAIINPPDSCILAVGGIAQKPVVKDGEIVVGNRMKVTLSCDHRVVDGATGAKFLQTFKDMLENPVRLMV
ncbi:MAG: pyruvate dehydrogenase complex dihydrolipoamide acetyltransferase [Saprospiraceae bacterium]|nr:pyruvate dehydrogenase complex dihydrolipoamide acetyltransferase [Saprospiraceae bacterium]